MNKYWLWLHKSDGDRIVLNLDNVVAFEEIGEDGAFPVRVRLANGDQIGVRQSLEKIQKYLEDFN